MSQEFRLVAIIDLQAGAWDEISDVVMECVHQSRKEEGNRFYTVHFEQDNHNRIVFIEQWASKEAIEIHSQTEHFKNLVKALKPYSAKPMQLLTLTEITG